VKETIQTKPEGVLGIRSEAKLPFRFWGGIGVLGAVTLCFAIAVFPSKVAWVPFLALELLFLAFVAFSIHILSLKVELHEDGIRVRSIFSNSSIRLSSIKSIEMKHRGARLVADDTSLFLPKIISDFDLILEDLKRQLGNSGTKPSEAPDSE
jgi:hypothetical protein